MTRARGDDATPGKWTASAALCFHRFKPSRWRHCRVLGRANWAMSLLCLSSFGISRLLAQKCLEVATGCAVVWARFCAISSFWNRIVSLRAVWALTIKSLQQATEIQRPRVELDDGICLRGSGQFYRGSGWREKPLVQLGVQYKGNLKLGSESSAYDSGRN
eukprot:s2138_g7.t1